MTKSVCVVYSDIVGWSKRPLIEQIMEVQNLFQTLVMQMEQYKLRAVWKTSTGDGFAIAFAREDIFPVLQICDAIMNQYSKPNFPRVRLAVAEGTIEVFQNPLSKQEDYTGPAIIKARRILDGIAAETVLLIQSSLVEDTKGRIPESMAKHLFEHAPIDDKHGGKHHVQQLVPQMSKERLGEARIPMSLQQVADLTRSEEIIEMEKCLGSPLSAMDNIIVLWMAGSKEGIPCVAVDVEPTWELDGTNHSIEHLEKIGRPFDEYISRYWMDVKADYGEPNNPKIWLKTFKSPLEDRPSMKLEVGRTDFWSTKCLEEAMMEGSLLKEYKSRKINHLEDTPGLVAAVSVLLTNDDHLILAQRKGRGEVDYAGGSWTATCEEQWNPLSETSPYQTVLRGLEEEYNLDRAHGVHVMSENIALYALGREWGQFYNTVLIYVVRLPAPAKRVLECWQSLPHALDKNEHVAVAAVPLVEEGITFLKNLIIMSRSDKLSVELLRNVCGSENIVGNPSDGLLFPTHGRAKIIVGLFAKGYLQ